MALYQNVFLGFAVPQRYHHELQNLKLKIKLTAPHFKPASSENPHITGIFLGEIDTSKFKEITEIVTNEKSLSRGTVVTVTSVGYFTPTRPRVVYLALDYPDQFKAYLEKLSNSLDSLIRSRERDKSFAPHITLGRNTTRHTQQAFTGYFSEVEEQIQSCDWKIPLHEIILYGRNPYTEQKQQEIIEVIPL